MKLKYRIKEWKHPFAKDFYTAQYRILGIWMNINSMGVGRLFQPSSTMCETFQEAKQRVKQHQLNMERAGDIVRRFGVTVWESK